MENKTTSRSQWFSKRPGWLQIAAKRLLEQDNFTDDDINEFVALCKEEAKGILKKEDCLFPLNFFSPNSTDTIRLCSIKNIEGINALSSKKSLEFPSRSLSVVYGLNGSGKSGYVRLLKHVCGARNPGPLLHNIFDHEPTHQKATMIFEKNGSTITYNWEEKGIIEELKTIDIFDSSINHIFISQESEVSYEPPVLSFFSKLISLSEKIGDELKAEIAQHPSKKPEMPPHLRETPEAKWYAKLSADTLLSEITFTREEKIELEKQLHQPSTREKEYEYSLIHDAQQLLEQLSDSQCQLIHDLKKTAELKKQIAETAIQRAFSTDLEIWKDLWSIARKYPEIEKKCVLCDQTLSPEAKERFLSFEKFVQDTTQEDAIRAENAYESTLNSLKQIPEQKELTARADAAGFNSERAEEMKAFFASLQKRIETLPEILPIGSTKWMNKASEKTPSKNTDSLLAKQWLFENRHAIEEEVKRLRTIAQIQSAKKLTVTTPLSIKKGQLATTLITEKFVQRFNDELVRLGAAQIQVELVKSKVSKGRVLHKLQLLNATTNAIKDVLSEGESRLLSIAAFLADVQAKSICSPFIFDDPISLLDRNNEEAVIKRLVELSQTHQVIIFTHRLSLLEKIRQFADSPAVISLS